MDTYHFEVEPFSEDAGGSLSWGVLGNHLLRVANRSASGHRFGYDDMQSASHAWVLSRLVIEMTAMPRTNMKYDISTWVTRVYRQFTDRLFSVTAPEGSALGFARSVWALIDINSRQPADLEHLEDNTLRNALEERDVPIAEAGRLRIGRDSLIATRRMMFSDLDINGHVNSIRYLQMMVDALYGEYGKGADGLSPRHHALKRAELSYSKESYLNDELNFYAEQEGERVFAVGVCRADGEVVVKGRFVFN